jgi:hypothetical protein
MSIEPGIVEQPSTELLEDLNRVMDEIAPGDGQAVEEEKAPEPVAKVVEEPGAVPEGQAKEVSSLGEKASEAPEGAEKQTEEKEEKPLSQEEIADLRKQATSYKEAQARMTQATTETARLKEELARLRAEREAEKTPEQRLQELYREAKDALGKGFEPSVKYDDENLHNGPQFFMEFATWRNEQAAVTAASEKALIERTGIIDSEFEKLTVEHGDTFKALQDKVIAHIKGRYQPGFIMAMPADEIPEFISKAVRAVEPKFFERVDAAAAARDIEAKKKAATGSLSARKAKGADNAPKESENPAEQTVAALNEEFKRQGMIY